MTLTRLTVPLNDVTTSFTPPVEFFHAGGLPANKGKSLMYNEACKAKQMKLYPDLQPLTSTESPVRMYQHALRVAQNQRNWDVVFTDETKFHFELVATSTLFGFKDDVAIEVRPLNEGSALHMRSRSRVGRSDFGANARRIEKFFKQI